MKSEGRIQKDDGRNQKDNFRNQTHFKTFFNSTFLTLISKFLTLTSNISKL